MKKLVGYLQSRQSSTWDQSTDTSSQWSEKDLNLTIQENLIPPLHIIFNFFSKYNKNGLIIQI